MLTHLKKIFKHNPIIYDTTLQEEGGVNLLGIRIFFLNFNLIMKL